MRYPQTLVVRLAGKLVLDVLPAMAASLIGGVLFTHYGLGRVAEPAAPVTSAPAEMMQLLRDEHGLIVSFLNAQLEREKSELVSENALRRPGGEAAATAIMPARAAVAVAAAKPVIARTRVAAAAGVSAPLVIAQVQQAGGLSAPSPAAVAPQSLFAKTIGLKDHVASVTYRVVSTLGGIPGWIGGHLGGTDTKPHPVADLIAAS